MSFSLEEFKKSSARAVNKAKSLITGQEIEESQPDDESPANRLEELAEYCPKLTFQQRLLGFAVSFTFGYLIAFFSFSFFRELTMGYPLPFAINYTIGNILQLLASTFLCGPSLQFRNMFDEKRRVTSITYLSCLVTTLVVIFIPLPGSVKLIVLLTLLLTQFCASVWYTLSYIPYGRRTLLRCMTRTLGLDERPDYGSVQLT